MNDYLELGTKLDFWGPGEIQVFYYVDKRNKIYFV